MSSQLLRSFPGHCFDVHVVRTYKQALVVLLSHLLGQYGQCRATESIQEVIRALNLTMRDVEELWRVWRHDSVRRTLQTGFGYTKDRIRAACWRRDQGRAPSAFMGYQSMFLAYRYTGSHTDDQPWQWVAEAGPVVPSGEVYYQYPYGDSAPLAQPNEAQYAQFTFTPNPAIAQQFYGLQQGVAPNTVHYPPPAYPPPHDYRSQQSPFPSVNTPPIPGSPPMSPAVAEAVEVATRFLEASNKAVNICIELNAM